MIFLAINRSIKFAFQSFWRNIWLSIATIFIISLALLSVNFLIMINAISDSAIAAVKDKIDVSIYFKTNIRENKIAEIKSHLEALSQVKDVIYKSPEENLADFTKLHQDNANIQETLKELEGNPLGATLIIKAKNLEDYPDILKAIDDPSYTELIEEKNYDDHQLVITRINQIADNVKKIGYVITILFAIISILIVFNTVRIAIFTHQNEISIMKLVGASNWFVRVPFIWESIFSGILATFIVMLIIYPALSLIQPHLSRFFEGAEFNLIGYFNSNFLWIFGGQLVATVILNVMSSSIAVGKYLNV